MRQLYYFPTGPNAEVQPITGLEDIPAGKNCFDLERIKIKPLGHVSTEGMSKAEANRLHARVSYYKRARKISREKALELVLRQNKFSELAYANRGAADRAGQIKKGGVL